MIDPSTCEHLDAAEDLSPGSSGCEDCLAIGAEWFHLRLCLSCGRVGCCDRSPNQHATTHFRAVGHPVIRSFQPGETWRWCFVDEIAVGLD